MADEKIEITLNVFDSEGKITGTTKVMLTTKQISDALDSAVQVVSDYRNEVDGADLAGSIGELDEALTSSGVLDESSQPTSRR